MIKITSISLTALFTTFGFILPVRAENLAHLSQLLSTKRGLFLLSCTREADQRLGDYPSFITTSFVWIIRNRRSFISQ